MSRCVLFGAGLLRRFRESLFIAVVVLFFSQAVTVRAFDESTVTNWTGTGTNVSYMVIDWGTDESLVWGYRWSDTATTYDMMTSIATADSRLLLHFQDDTQWGHFLFALGYDAENNGTGFTLGTPGVVTETGHANDSNNYYHEGVETGFWAFYTYAGNVASPSDDPYSGGIWSGSMVGVDSAILANNSWSGFTFSSDTDTWSSVEPSLPIAAEAVPEPSSIALMMLGASCLLIGTRLQAKKKALL